MPNTKSAERRVRNSERKNLRNRTVESKLSTLEKAFRTAADGGDKAKASAALKPAIAAFDKAAKHGVIHRATADRKKSRLSLRLNRVK